MFCLFLCLTRQENLEPLILFGLLIRSTQLGFTVTDSVVSVSTDGRSHPYSRLIYHYSLRLDPIIKEKYTATNKVRRNGKREEQKPKQSKTKNETNWSFDQNLRDSLRIPLNLPNPFSTYIVSFPERPILLKKNLMLVLVKRYNPSRMVTHTKIHPPSVVKDSVFVFLFRVKRRRSLRDRSRGRRCRTPSPSPKHPRGQGRSGLRGRTRGLSEQRKTRVGRTGPRRPKTQ